MKMPKNERVIQLNLQNGPRDIPFQSQIFEQDRRRHSVGFNL